MTEQMLDSDSTNPPAETDAAPAPRKRAPRKAAAKAGPPPQAPPAEQDTPAVEAPASSSEESAPAPRKRAPRKSAAKKAQPEVETSQAQVVAPEVAAATVEPVEPVKKTPAKRTRKATKAAGAPAEAPSAAPADVPAVDLPTADLLASDLLPVPEPTDTAAPAKKAARKRVSKKAAAAAAAAEPTGDLAAADPTAVAPDDTAVTAMAAPGVLFKAPSVDDVPAAPRRRRAAKKTAPVIPPVEDEDEDTLDGAAATLPTDDTSDTSDTTDTADGDTEDGDDAVDVAGEQATGARRRRRRGRRGRGGGGGGSDSAETGTDPAESDSEDDPTSEASGDTDDAEAGDESGTGSRRRRRRRRSSNGSDDDSGQDDPPNTVTHVREKKASRTKDDPEDDGVKGVKGSTRLEAKRQRRRDGRDTSRRRAPILTESEFLARREAVDRVMAVRQHGDRTQIAVLEDNVLVEHYVTRASATSYVGNVYLGRVQNVLPSMEAAFIDIGKGRNGVLYAGEVNWDAAGLEGKSRAIEQAMKSGDPVLVQVTKDPIGHKGARLTSQVSLPGRFLVYVPGGGMTGISRRLPDTERHRLKAILKKIVPEDAGVIVRTAAEGATEEDLTRDVERLQAQWETIKAKAEQKKSAPVLVHGEPDLAIRVVRDVFNEDFTKLVVEGGDAWDTLSEYIGGVAPDLAERVSRHTADTDLFHDLRVDEQLMKALDRKVWLPSGGSLVIDRTEAMTVVDVNTGKFVGAGGNLEQTVTRNNIEAAEEIVRQLRLRDVGGIVVIDFIDMILESNRELVLRRLTECLGRDRTKHQVAEVTSLGLVQMTRKRVGEGLLEAFSEPCEHCHGRGVLVHSEPVDQPSNGGSSNGGSSNGGSSSGASDEGDRPKGKRRRGRGSGNGSQEPAEAAAPVPAATDEQRRAASAAIAAIHQAAGSEGEADSDEVAELASGLVQAMMRVDQHGADVTTTPVDEPAVDEPAVEAPTAEAPPVEAPAEDTAPAAAEQQPADPTAEAVVSTAASELGVPRDDSPAAPAVEPEQAPAHSPDDAPAAPAGRRRRRAASRPAGPPVGGH